MNKFFIATGLSLAFLSSMAQAADLPRRYAAPPPTPVYSAPTRMPIFSWTGFYAGLHAGYGFGKTRGTLSGGFDKPDGFVGGGQLGYNMQFNQVVLGAEADFSFSDINGKHVSIGVVGQKSRMPYFGTVRGRLGYAVDRFLPYVTAGYAYSKLRATIPGRGMSSDMRNGWVLGIGTEYAFTNSITGRIEGLYMGFQDKNVLQGKLGAEVGVIRAGINTKF